MRNVAALFITFVVMVACAAAPQSPQILDPTFTPGEFGKVALAPVVFADHPLDRYLGTSTADRIQRDAGQALRVKGYEIIVLAPPYGLQVPAVQQGAELASLVPAIPPGADAVVLIRIDHFLDTGLYERKSRIPVEIHATAAFMTPEGNVLWRDEGMGQTTAFSSGYDSLEVLQLSSRLVESLFATLPPRHR